ncbi:YsnF/AvaK domain-containing protein [Flaviaesturariibacter amylovorans]|uniref:PRC and DUF2382 domain-containing protein n=1 Tax=Flaviaesturariibacter amylovorans TaxID=1084520 RepID=A0ABP8G7P9_9BACT
MAQTVIGLFDRAGDAQSAIRELMSGGITRERIDLSSGGRGATEGTGSTRGSAGSNDRNPVSNFFRSLFGGDNADSARYSHVAERASTIVTVHAVSRSEAELAAGILDRCGAIDVDERARSSGFAQGRGERTDADDDRRTTVVPRIEEQLHVGKREVEAGGVRVHSRIIEKPVEESIRLREENVRIERQSVDRPVAEHERVNQFRERDIELTERAEIPVIHKQARVVEEVRIRTEVSEHDETVRETLRRTDIDVEQLRNDARGATGSTGHAGTGNAFGSDLGGAPPAGSEDRDRGFGSSGTTL